MDFTKLYTLNEELEQMKQQYQLKVQKILKEVFTEFFDNNRTVTAVGWKAYTPYFNDGEPCEFRCEAYYAWVTNAKDYHVVEYGQYNGDEENVWVYDGDYGSFNDDLIPGLTKANAKDLRKFLSKIDDQFYLDAFGDHVKVFVTREGIEVVEYTDHD